MPICTNELPKFFMHFTSDFLSEAVLMRRDVLSANENIIRNEKSVALPNQKIQFRYFLELDWHYGC